MDSDSLYPTFQEPASTPVVDSANDEFTGDDGSAYRRVDANEFDCFDEVDSTTICDDGAPA